jgi:hypothetical protein
MKPVKALLLAGLMALAAFRTIAQTSDSRLKASESLGAATAGDDLATPKGNEVNVSVSGYTYLEPNPADISIHGTKVGGEYIGTLSFGRRGRWFARVDVRGTTGTTTYDGWCAPYLISPNGASPNGYELDLGARSPCSETGERDWYVETRGLIGRDLIGERWAVSPYAGLGFRHLSNGLTGIAGYRTDDYLYLPLGVTLRTEVASSGLLSFNLEAGYLLRGRQTTRDSERGGGEVPATPTAPGFTVNGFSDVSFTQHGGVTLRASAKYRFTSHWSVEPYYIHWSVDASSVTYEAVTFTVNGVTARERMGFYEPDNETREFGVKLGFRF